jgi:hypothetical protein
MTIATVLPASGASFFDVRDGGRSLRVTWHPRDDMFVLSMWRDGQCAGTFQLERSATPELINSLVTNLAAPVPTSWTAPHYTTIERRRWLALRRRHR